MAPPPVAGVSKNQSGCVPGTDGCSSQGFLTQKEGRQVEVPITWVVSGAATATGSWLFFSTEFLKDPQSSKFTNHPLLTRILYDPDSSFNQTATRAIPSRLRPLLENREGVRVLADRFAMLGSGIDTVAQAIRLSNDIVALSECLDAHCSMAESIAIGVDTAAAGSETVSKGMMTIGTFILSRDGASTVANKLLGASHGLVVVGGGALQIFAGGARLYAEVSHFRQTGDFNPSAAAQDISDSMYGVYTTGRSAYALGQASKAAGIASASSILAFQNVAYGNGITLFLRSAGVLGAVASIGVNGYSVIGEGLLASDLSDEQRTRNMISGGIGLTGDAFMLASVLIVAGAFTPVSIGLFVVGSLIHVGQFYYDHHDEMNGGAEVSFHDPNLWFKEDGSLVYMEPPDCLRFEWKGLDNVECITSETPAPTPEPVYYAPPEPVVIVLLSEEEILEFAKQF